MLADVQVMRLVVNGGIKTRLAVAVAVQIAEMDVAGVGYGDGPRKRLEGTNHPVGVEIGEGDVAGRINLNRQREAAFAPFLLGLRGVKAPAGGVGYLDFAADVVLAGNLVGAAPGLSIRHEHSGLGKGRGGPNIEEGAAAAIGDPEAGILAVPMAIGIGVGRVAVVVRVLAGAIRLGRAVSAKESDIVH